jgi:hypothetical protein
VASIENRDIDGYVPIRVAEVELSARLPRISPATTAAGVPYGRARILVRIHTIPLGFVDLELPLGPLPAETLASAIEADLGPRIRQHLEADGLTAGPRITADGVGHVGDPACLAPRRAILASGPSVSVVVPTIDRPDDLRACVADLLAQRYPHVDIIVVDNAPETSGAAAVIGPLAAAHPNVRYVLERRRGSSRARNRGLAESTSEITAFVDGDVRVDRWWLASLITAMAPTSGMGGMTAVHPACATGAILSTDLETAPQSWLEEWGGYTKGFEPRLYDLDRHRGPGPLYPFSPAALGSGANMAFTTEVLRGIGGFDPALGGGTAAQGGEDIAAFVEVITSRHALAYAPSAIVWHTHPDDDDAFHSKIASYGVGLTAYLTRHATRHPGDLARMFGRVPQAARYLLAPGSPRNARHSTEFPPSVLRDELRGMIRGPFAYAVSRGRARRARSRHTTPSGHGSTSPPADDPGPIDIDSHDTSRPPQVGDGTSTPSLVGGDTSTLPCVAHDHSSPPRVTQGTRRSRLAPGWFPVIAAATGGGLLLLGLSDKAGREGADSALPLFWAGTLLIVLPAAWRLFSRAPGRGERVAIVLLLGLGLYLVKVMASPVQFTLPDEFSHLRTLDDIIRTGHLFSENPLLQISAVYPGLESATAGLMVSSGLASFPVAMILTAAARGVLILAVFLITERAVRSARVAGIAALIYASNPSFLYFDAQFAYESLALPIALLAVWATLRWTRSEAQPRFVAVIALTAIAVVAMTHHLTSLVLLVFLAGWAILSLRGDNRARLRPVLIAALWALFSNFVWLVWVAGSAIGYLSEIVGGGVQELLGILTGSAAGRQLFTPRPGVASPVPEIVVGYLAVALILVCLPFVLWRAWVLLRRDSFIVVIAIAAAGYPASLALRLTSAGAETSQRASEFLFLSLGLLGGDWLAGKPSWRFVPRGNALVVAGLGVVFAGGTIVGDPPQARIPGPYHVAAEQRSIEPQGLDTAAWVRNWLGLGNRFIADRINGKLIGSYGAQYPVTAFNQSVGTAYVMFASHVGPDELEVLKRGRIDYILVDLRMARDTPVFSVYFESAEPDAGHHTQPIPLASLEKFDALPGATRVYDSGDIVIYDVRRLVDALP